jgi:hypothetical protein
MRPGAEYFLTLAGASQRRYEAQRAYFVGDMPAAEVADRFGYCTPQRAPDGHAAARPDSPTSKYPSLVGRPHPAVPVPATMITSPWATSTQLPDRESRLTLMIHGDRSLPWDGCRAV